MTAENKNKRVWSPAQLSAINTRSKKILVSASAGSGKSSVLTERIITSLLSEERNFDISRLLVVTFTKESAEDLKFKIAEAMRKASDSDPGNKRLAEQLIKLPSASISTIHSLCLSIIKSNFSNLKLSAALRVADDSEIAAIRSDIMNRLLEDAYSGNFEPTENYADFFDNFVSDRDEKLSDLFFGIYDRFKNHEDGAKTWEAALITMELGNFEPDDPFCALLCKNVEIATDYYVLLCTQALDYFRQNEDYSIAIDHFEYLRQVLAAIHEFSVKCDYRGIRDLLLTVDVPSLKSLKNGKTDEGEYYRTDLNKLIKEKIITKYKNDIFCYSDDDIKILSKKGADISRSILCLLKEFDRRFAEEKARRSILDYSDLEHRAIELLNKEEIARQFSSLYDEIYVDEYQDVNPIQNKIFEILSSNTPLFMVGDIKQSIYGFRGAMPEIFSEYRRSFLDKAQGSDESAKIFLSTNYRSKAKILEFSNTVSDGMFRTPTQSCFDYRIPYSIEDRMLCGPNAYDDPSPDVEILIAKTSKASEDSDEESHDPKNICVEAEMVAKRIRSLIDSGTKESDIAVLLRSSVKISDFQRALRAHGIAVMTNKGASLFETSEIQLALCILNCVDNPYRDIFLSGTLRSPMFAFTFDDLINIRREKKNCSLYEALTSYVYTHNFPKGTRFLSFLERMRGFALSNPADRVLWQIYTETSFFSHIHDEENISQTIVSRRRANLLKLHSLACEFTASGKTDIYSFVERLRKTAESKDPPKGASDEGSGVKIMTIHASKGLEFEHCFLCRTGSNVNDRDQSEATIYNSEFGCATKIKDELGLTVSDTPHRRALSYYLRLIQRDEELRVLYVALTRAKTALYITAEVKDTDKLNTTTRMDALNPHPMIFLNRSNYISWILTALRMKTDLAPRFNLNYISEAEILSDGMLEPNITFDKTESSEAALDREVYEKLSKRLSFKYPYARSAEIPSKLAVSRLYPGVLDEADDDFTPDITDLDLPFSFDDTENSRNNAPDLDVPKFIRESETHSGSERGTATHVFMQFCDLESLEKNGFDYELSRLTEKRFILPAMAELVNRKHIESFLSSELYKEMKKAVYLQREYRFNIKLPASDFTEDPELKEAIKDDNIFVQGVIDCYYRTEDGKTVLLDYKTDKVPNGIIGDNLKEDEFFKERYSRQLSYYKTALERLTGRTVDKAIIYSFMLGRTINLK